MTNSKRTATTILLLIAVASSSATGQTVRTWDSNSPGTFRWNQNDSNASWTGSVPDTSSEIARIADDGRHLQIYSATNSVTVDGVELAGNGSSVSVWSGRSLTLTGDSSVISNGATLNIGIAPTFTSAITNGTIAGNSAANTLLNQGVIQGTGTISAGFVNADTGQIIANQSGRSLAISGGNTRTNEGSIAAQSGGIVRIETSITNTATASITAKSGSQVSYNGASVSGGLLNGEGTGVHRVIGGNNVFTNTEIGQSFEANGGVAEFQGINQVTTDFTVGASGTVNITNGTQTFQNLDNSLGGSFNHTNGEVVVTGGTFSPNDRTSGYTVGGAGSGDHATVTLKDGAGWNAPSTLAISDGSDGTVNLESGAVLDGVNFLRVGRGISEAGGTGTLSATGDGTSITVNSVSSIGIAATGNLAVAAGADADLQRVQIGLDAGASGTVSVTGNGSTLTATQVDIGGRPGEAGGNGAFSVANNAVATVTGVTTIHDHGTLTVDGGTLNTQSLFNVSGAYQHADGHVIVDGGTFDPGTSTINGAQSGDHATVSLRNDATWDAGSALSISDGNNATLNVESGADLTSVSLLRIGRGISAPGGTGTLTATGEGTTVQVTSVASVGIGATGIFNVQEGADVDLQRVQIGLDAGATGSVNVTGNGSTLTATDVHIGGRPDQSGGTGSMTISNNAVATVSGPTRVYDHGTLTVESGGTLNTQSLSNESGVFRIDGGSVNNSGDTLIGTDGAGTFDVTNGGSLDTTGNLILSSSSSNTGVGTVNQSGGTVAANDVLVSNFGQATYNITGGTLTARDDLFIGNNGADSAGTVNLSGPAVINVTDATFLGNQELSSGTVTQSGGELNTRILGVGRLGTGTYDLEGGTISVTEDVRLGDFASGVGTMTQTAGAVNAADLNVGEAGTGTYNLNGGTVSISSATTVGADGTLNINGGTLTTGSLDNIAGGTFNHNGGELVVSGGTFNPVGSSANYTIASGSSGHTSLATVTLIDGATWNADGIRIGSADGGQGVLNVRGGTVDNSGDTEIGVHANGTLFVNSGGTFQSSGDIHVGVSNTSSNGSIQHGSGTVSSGGSVFVNSGNYVHTNGILSVQDDLMIGSGFRSSGSYHLFNAAEANVGNRMAVGGNDSTDARVIQHTGGRVAAQLLDIGQGGTGSYVVRDGTVSITNATTIGARGTLTIEGGEFSTGSFDNSHGGELGLTSGTFTVDGTLTPGTNFTMTGGTLEAATIVGDLSFSGGVLDVVTMNGNLNQLGGTLAPGDSPGTTTINGDYTLSSGGMIDMEIAGLLQGTEYDYVDINGDWFLNGGTLNVSLLGGFTPLAGASFDLFDFDSILGLGVFDLLNLPTLTSGLAWNTSSLYSDGTLSVFADPAAVPEPSSTIALGLGLCGAGWWRRRQTRKC